MLLEKLAQWPSQMRENHLYVDVFKKYKCSFIDITTITIFHKQNILYASNMLAI
jgi:hypothetical protein